MKRYNSLNDYFNKDEPTPLECGLCKHPTIHPRGSTSVSYKPIPYSPFCKIHRDLYKILKGI